jgi:glycine/D-amino acid oxidase-like deaminating enzyme
MFDFLIIGGGVFGLTAAIELAHRKHKVGLINPDTIPHHLAASTDISKVVRMEYGSDLEYFKMAETSIQRWHEWNEMLDEKVYHETGFLMLCKENIDNQTNTYEKSSYNTLIHEGYKTERLNKKTLKDRFPAVNTDIYIDANFNTKGGFVESGLAIQKLAEYARKIGVEIFEHQTAKDFIIENNRLMAVKTQEGKTFHFGHLIVAAGAHTPYLLPELQPFMKTTGHPVFWLKPHDSKPFTVPDFTVFMADIANSGWYGFPFLAKKGIIKIAKHSEGLHIHPDKNDRIVTAADIADMRQFVKETFPALADAPLVYTRRCLYTDTLDGHFWIDQHPTIKGLTVSTGGSGHAMKMAPVLGKMTADIAEGKPNLISNRYQWRHLGDTTIQAEEARFLKR